MAQYQKIFDVKRTAVLAVMVAGVQVYFGNTTMHAITQAILITAEFAGRAKKAGILCRFVFFAVE